MGTQIPLIETAVKGTAILGVAWLIVTILRRRSAAARHLVWSGAFAALLVLPLLSALMPALPVPAATPLFTSGAVFRASAATAPEVLVAQFQRGFKPTAESHGFDWLPWAMLLWGLGTAVTFAHLLGGAIVVARIRRAAATSADSELNALAQVLGIRRGVMLRRTRPGSMPMAVGLFRPAILLPADAAEWSSERRRLVLLHELAHVQRGDLPLHLLARTSLSFYWWNPLAWLAWREFLKERERAADDLVLHAGARASEYASHLLDIARTMRSSPILTPAALAMARPSQLEGRLLAILDSGVNRRTPRRASIAIAATLALAALAPLAAVRAQDRTATLPADVDATIRAAASQKNHEMLESAAKAAEVLQQYDLARRLLDSSLEIRADVSGSQSVAYGTGLIKIGDLERSRNRFTEAEAFYAKAASVIGNRPEAAPALVNLGIFASRMKDPEAAFGYFQQAQAADPVHAGTPLMWMAVIREQQKDSDESEALFKQALAAENPNSAQSALTDELYALFLRRQGRNDEAKLSQDQASAVRKALGAEALSVRRTSGIEVARMGPGMTAPSLLLKVEPQYSEEARLAKYQGTVVVSAVIGADGLAQSMRVIRGLGLGLDEQALKAIAQWKFKPGAKDGDPLPVQATIEVNFRLL